MEPHLKTNVVIIGAGLTGLVTAHYLLKSGITVKIVEKNNRPGGVIQTIKEQGFTIEAGPNTGVVSHPEIVELFEDLKDECIIDIANPEAKKRLIWKEGAWHALPSGLLPAIKTPLFSLGDKFRIMGEPFRKKGTNPDESIADLVVRRMGKSYLNYAVDPFISGIYAGDPTKLVTRFALPKLYNLEQKYGSFIGGMIKKGSEPKDDRTKKATREVFSAKGGLQNLIDALVKSIGSENILLNCMDVAVSNDNQVFNTAFSMGGIPVSLSSEKVISTAGGKQIGSLFPFVGQEQLQAIEQLEYAKVVQVALGYQQWKGISINAFGGLVPSIQKRKILGVLFPSSFFENRAPKEGALLSVFLGGIKHDEYYMLKDDEIQTLVETEIGEMLKIKGIKADVLKIFRYQYAIPQYTATSEKRLEAINFIQKHFPGLILAGNIRDGIGMGDRIKQGRAIAEEIINN
ncbi:MAG TPA: protoporphyrinogen oxidase [Prolixibacteraceae bacterium]|jgi:oxygen-dependent protoporphyrinogen oxidase